jgi:predicted ATP-dependent serine protease
MVIDRNNKQRVKEQLQNASDIFEDKAVEVVTAETMKKDNQIDLNLFDRFQMTKQRREELKNMKYVINGLIVENYHTYLMGNAGAGKTTIMLHLCFEMVEKGYKIIYFYLDGALNTASKVGAEIERLNIENDFKLLVDGTMNDYKEILQSFISTKTRLDKTVFVLDTFKFLSADINHKNANKDAMHLIKEVCKLGATFVSLGHTNKDGVKFSGTAEIEQDSDGVLKIDGYEDNTTTTSTIKKGGRCRYEVKEVSYKFERGDVLSVTKLDDVFDAESKIKELELLEKDKYLISEVKRVLRLNPNMLQKDIIQEVNEATAESKNKIIKILNTYLDKHWSKTQSKEALNGYEYKVIDTDFDKLIENLQNNLQKPQKVDTSPPVEVETKENDLSLFES